MSIGKIVLYCHVEEGTGIVSEGDWLFHTGQWAECVEATQEKDGSWSLYIDFEKTDKHLTHEG